MSEELNQAFTGGVEGWNQGVGLVEKLFSVAQPGAVFGHPVQAEGQTVITASEVMVGLGFGFGSGGGSDEAPEDEGEVGEKDTGFGMGGGGGGGSTGRPVAAISISADGVRVDPIVDVTKLGLAFFTAFGAMFVMLGRMRRVAGG